MSEELNSWEFGAAKQAVLAGQPELFEAPHPSLRIYRVCEDLFLGLNYAHLLVDGAHNLLLLSSCCRDNVVTQYTGNESYRVCFFCRRSVAEPAVTEAEVKDSEAALEDWCSRVMEPLDAQLAAVELSEFFLTEATAWQRFGSGYRKLEVEALVKEREGKKRGA